MNLNSVSIFDLSPPEKLQLVEDLWDDLASTPSEVSVSKTGKLLIVCHTFQEENEEAVSIRVFSSRKATREESKFYGG